MDSEEILRSYVGQPNTEVTRSRLTVQMVDSLQNFEASISNRWENPCNEIDVQMLNSDLISMNDPSNFYRRNSFVLDYPDSYLNSHQYFSHIPREKEKVSFVEIVSNINNSDMPFQCQIGMQLVGKGSKTFFEDIPLQTIKRSLHLMVIELLKKDDDDNSLFSLGRAGSTNKKWFCKKPLKVVDIVKECLDETLIDLTKKFFITQNKLQHFKLTKGVLEDEFK